MTDPRVAVVTMEPREPFRILMVTDFHDDASDELAARTHTDVRALAVRCRPHLLAATGDLWCSDVEPERAPARMQRVLDLFASLRIPWAMVWGNHDYTADFRAALQQIAHTPHSLLPPGNPDGSFRVEVRRVDEPLPRWDVFFINTREQWRLPEDLAWFEAEAQRLRETRGRVVPAVLFFHIPLRNYQRAIDEGRTVGCGDELVLHWGDDDDIAAPIIKRAGNVRACFCGHSHKNDFHFEEDGVLFAYGRASGHGGYGGEELSKGATLIELDADGDRLQFHTVLFE